MKIRKGFVSNSSSSSFICDVCGADESGWDISLDDAMMYECVKGHVFCEDHIIKEGLDSLSPDQRSYISDRYDTPVSCCPICTFDSIISNQAIKFLLKKSNMTIQQLTDEIKNTFESYDDFMDHLSG